MLFSLKALMWWNRQKKQATSIRKSTVTQASPDQARSDPADDRLAHATFAKNLATAICQMTPPDGLVLALYGPWGAGKTTILNFVKYYLGKEPEDRQPIVVDFAPWWFSGQEDLTQRFFDQLLARLRNAKGVLTQSLRLVEDFAGSIADLPVPLVAQLAKASSDALRLIRNARQKDLTLLKGNVEDALRQQHRHILIVIDDLDRLTADEIQHVFRLIKAVANFPNTIYLLAFDKQVAIKAVEHTHGNSGRQYLDKIVQVSWEVPPPDRLLLFGLLSPVLEAAFAGTPDDLFDQNDWNNMLALLLRFLNTPRDATRLANAIVTTYPAVRGEVNFTDFVAMEALRAFVPALYELIRAEPEQFAGISARGESGREAKEFHQRWLDNSEMVPRGEREIVQGVIARLFPRARSAFDNIGLTYSFLETWRKECRAASPDILPIYFRLAAPAAGISRARVVEILKSAAEPAHLRATLQRLLLEKLPDGRTLLSSFLDKAQDVAQVVEPSAVVAVLGALLDDPFLIPSDVFRGFGYPIDNTLRIFWFVQGLLRRFPQEERAGFVTAALREAKGFPSVVELVGSLAAQHSGRASVDPVLPKACCDELQQFALDQIRQAAANGVLADTPLLARVLYLWKQWGPPGEVKQFVDEFVGSDEGLRRLLEISTGEGRQMSGHNPVPSSFLTLNLRGLTEFVDMQTLTLRARRLQTRTDLTEKQKFAISEVLNPSQPAEVPEAGETPS